MSHQHHTFEEDFDYLSVHIQVEEKRLKGWTAHYWLAVEVGRPEGDVRAKARKHAKLAKKVTKRTQRVVRVVTHHVRKTVCSNTTEVL